jgi:hypothetical protein
MHINKYLGELEEGHAPSVNEAQYALQDLHKFSKSVP